LREAELADAAQEDTTHDWQRLQFALKREKSKPVVKVRSGFKFYPIAASVIIVVCATSVILETIKEPGYSTSAPAPVAITMPPPVAHAPPVIASPPTAAGHSTDEHAKVKAAPNQKAMQLMSRQHDMDMNRESERSAPVEETTPPRSMMTAPPAIMAPPVTVMRGNSEQVVLSAMPEQDANQLEAELVQLGISVVKSNSEDKFKLHIALIYPVKDAVHAVLEARAIPVPERGDLTVVFVQTSQTK